MFNHYYDLRNESTLPVGVAFHDPIDNSVYHVKPKESLPDFINRVAKGREDNSLPAFFPEELKKLVVVSLAEATSPQERPKYFEPKAIVPGISDIVGLAQAMVAQRQSGDSASYLLRQERATKCHGCVLHKRSANINKTTMKIIGKLAGLRDLAQSESEKALGVCGMCGCGLQSKVRFDISGTLAGVSPTHINKILQAYGSQAFDKCWILNESIQDGRFKRVLMGKVQNAGQRAASLMTTYFSNKTQASKK